MGSLNTQKRIISQGLGNHDVGRCVLGGSFLPLPVSGPQVPGLVKLSLQPLPPCGPHTSLAFTPFLS